jgi:ABC-type nitrate/sulfonate/bicarbonate transport system ATPase subunit
LIGKASEKVVREEAADTAMVEARGVEKEYAADGVRVHALRGVDLSIARGEMVAVMDPPAAGRRRSSTAYE